MSSTILSTKRLSLAQKELLLHGNLGLVEYDAIHIRLADFNFNGQYDCLVFTSQNAVLSYIRRKKLATPTLKGTVGNRAVCVGEKTALLLERNGVEVLASAANAKTLGQLILEKFPDTSFLFVCGNLRREYLPCLFQKHNIRYKEVVAYETTLRPRLFKRRFDAILFYSPSGVQSYVALNALANTTAVCIGPTTLAEAKKYTHKAIQATKPTVENVIVQAVKYFSTAKNP